MKRANNGPRKLVLVGGGHTHVQVLKSFASEPPADIELTVVIPSPVAIYSGMVPGFVAGRYGVEELGIDVEALAHGAGARVVLELALTIDADRRQIMLEGGDAVSYDLASFNIGSTVAGLDTPGVRQHAIPTRPISGLIETIDALVEQARDRDLDRAFRIVVVGGGAGGIELAFCLESRLAREAEGPFEVLLVNDKPRVLVGYPESLAERVERHARSRGMAIDNHRRVIAVEADLIRFEDGDSTAQDAVIWATGAASHPLFRESNLPTDPRGFVMTRSTLQIDGHDELFAVGDCATLIEHPDTPKAGVYAVRQGPILTRNLRAALDGQSLGTYVPQRDFLTLLNLGDGTALGTKWGLSFEGRWVMELKDRIDRRFMSRFRPDGPA
jgi:selenide,water dikinase